eukprot:3031044-Ditylum_brightwellii.AAC.1
MTLEQYLDEFTNRREVLEECGGEVAYHPGLVDSALREAGFDPDDTNSYTTEDREEAERDAKEAYLAFMFLSNANKIRFAPLMRDLANSYLM